MCENGLHSPARKSGRTHQASIKSDFVQLTHETVLWLRGAGSRLPLLLLDIVDLTIVPGLDDIPSLSRDNTREGLIWRFIAAISLAHYGTVDLLQKEQEILVMKSVLFVSWFNKPS